MYLVSFSKFFMFTNVYKCTSSFQSELNAKFNKGG